MKQRFRCFLCPTDRSHGNMLTFPSFMASFYSFYFDSSICSDLLSAVFIFTVTNTVCVRVCVADLRLDQLDRTPRQSVHLIWDQLAVLKSFNILSPAPLLPLPSHLEILTKIK